eukprot:219398-Chlamydomonas_euryale.AAC.1
MRGPDGSVISGAEGELGSHPVVRGRVHTRTRMHGLVYRLNGEAGCGGWVWRTRLVQQDHLATVWSPDAVCGRMGGC